MVGFLFDSSLRCIQLGTGYVYPTPAFSYIGRGLWWVQTATHLPGFPNEELLRAIPFVGIFSTLSQSLNDIVRDVRSRTSDPDAPSDDYRISQFAWVRNRSVQRLRHRWYPNGTFS